VDRPLELSEDVGRIGISPNQPLSIIGISDPRGPAALAELRNFDWLVSAAGKNTERWVDLEKILDKNRGSLVPLTVLRPERVQGALGARLGVSVYVPRVATMTPEPGSEGSGRLRAGLEPADLYVSHVVANSPEASAGLQVGDRLIALDAKPIRHWTSFLEDLAAGRSQPHALLVRRAGELHALSYQLGAPRKNSEYPQAFEHYVMGIRRWSPTVPFPEIDNPSPVSYAFHEAIRATSEVVELTAVSVVRLFQGRLSVKSIGGPLTIFDAAGEAAREGALNYLFLMGFISVNLGLINLMPIPMLDGGHLLFFLIELVARRPLSVRVREYASIAGLTILILLMVFAFKNDVERQWPQVFQSSGE
jgi:regulator of sigma E protease